MYGLALKEESYYANKLEKAILLAPCLFAPTTGFEDYKQSFPVMRDAGINVANDANWA